MSERPVGLKKIIYCIIGIAILIYCGYIVEVLVMHIWHKVPHGAHTEESMSKDDKLYQEMVEGVDEKDHTGKAVVDITQSHKLYSFHDTKRKAVLDTQNLCVLCHGDVPHDKKKEVRAFLNMHTYFMACETCHIRTENSRTAKYVWYDKITGKEQDKIDLSLYLADTPYKLMPLNEDGSRLYDSDQMKKYVAEFRDNVDKMIPTAKSAGLKVIHRPMTDVKETVSCGDCHTADTSKVYLPFKKIGYPERRMDQLVGNEVVGMINNYKKFFMPEFLKPDEEKESEN